MKKRMFVLAAVIWLACGKGGAGGGTDTTGQEAFPNPDATEVLPDARIDPGTEPDAGEDASGDPGGPPVWESWYEPGVEKRGPVWVLRLKGSFYEMGRQHATLMRDALLEGIAYIEGSELGLLEPMMKAMGYLDEAYAQSYDSVFEECRGMTDVLEAEGWTLDRCLSLAYGEVFLEHLKAGGPGCSQFVVTGAGTADGAMVHGRNMDWDRIEYLLKYPVVIVRHPEGRIPYAVVGFPGCVAPYNGINAAGLSVASNEANSDNDIDRVGRSHVQMIAEVLGTATGIAEARAFFEAQDHMTAEILVVADGAHDTAAVFEMSATHMAAREMGPDGVVFATNHFVDPAMAPYHLAYGPGKSSMTRYQRLGQLVPPDGVETRYGTFDPTEAVRVLRDRHNPYTGEDAAWDVFDGAGTIANNGNIWSIVFVPGDGVFYAAAGPVPVPKNPYVGFSLDELLGRPGATSPPPLDPPEG